MPTTHQVAVGSARRGGRHAVEYLRAVAEVAHATVDGAEVDDVFRLIAHEARSLVGAASSTIATLGPEPGNLTIRAADGASADRLPRGTSVPIEGTLAAAVVRTGRTLIISEPDSAPAPLRSVLLRFALGPAVCMPLLAHGKVFGAMAVARAPGAAPFRAVDVALIEGFAGQAVVALEFSRMRDELRRLAVVDERERIARELHEVAAFVLFEHVCGGTRHDRRVQRFIVRE